MEETTHVRIPCIKYNPNTWNYIKEQLESFGYTKVLLNDNWIIDPYIIINLDNNLGNYSNVSEDGKLCHNREIVNNTEEFLERAASLMGKTYKRKDMKKEFTKGDLKSGMVVKTRNNQIYLVVDNMIISDWGYIILNSYTENLQFPNHEYDIMAIYDKIACWEDGFSDGLSSAPYNGELIWERKEPKEYTMQEIADKLGIPVEQLRIKK